MPMGANYRGNGKWSRQTQDDKKKKKQKPGLGTRSKNAPRPTFTPSPTDNETDASIPELLNSDDSASKWLNAILRYLDFTKDRVKFVGFSHDQQMEIEARLVVAVLFKPCVDAYNAFPGIQATPAEVIRDRGITFVNATSLEDPKVIEDLGFSQAQGQEFLNRFKGFFGYLFGAGASARVPRGGYYKKFPNERIFIGVNFGSWQSDLKGDIFHELVHAGGVEGSPPISPTGHDLSNFGPKYDRIIEDCNPK